MSPVFRKDMVILPVTDKALFGCHCQNSISSLYTIQSAMGAVIRVLLS